MEFLASLGFVVTIVLGITLTTALLVSAPWQVLLLILVVGISAIQWFISQLSELGSAKKLVEISSNSSSTNIEANNLTPVQDNSLVYRGSIYQKLSPKKEVTQIKNQKTTLKVAGKYRGATWKHPWSGILNPENSQPKVE